MPVVLWIFLTTLLAERQGGQSVLPRHYQGTGASRLNIPDTEETLLNRQWIVLLHVFSTAEPHSRELDPLQLKMMFHGGLQKRELLTTRQRSPKISESITSSSSSLCTDANNFFFFSVIKHSVCVHLCRTSGGSMAIGYWVHTNAAQLRSTSSGTESRTDWCWKGTPEVAWS